MQGLVWRYIADQITTFSVLENGKNRRWLDLESVVVVTRRLPSLTLDIALQFQMYVYVLEQRNSLGKLEKMYSNFKNQYHRHSELIVIYNIGLKTLLKQGISDPIFYGDLVYKF